MSSCFWYTKGIPWFQKIQKFIWIATKGDNDLTPIPGFTGVKSNRRFSPQ